MADVYAAYDTVLRRPVALKLVHMCDPLSVSRLLQEARSQARIEHENVCEVFEVGQHDGRFYIAMQYIDGGTFRAMAREMTLEQKLRVVKEAADGLHAAHRTGLIHRDLKPSNIMVQRREDGGWKAFVTDFGLARGADDPRLTVSGMVMGTAAYMAPEHARGEGRTLDRRTDIYGLGATQRINPDLAEAHAVEGTLHLWRARRLKDRAERAQAARMAASSLDAALRTNPLLSSEYKALLDEATRLAAQP